MYLMRAVYSSWHTFTVRTAKQQQRHMRRSDSIHLESLFPFIAISGTSADGEQWQRAQCFLCSDLGKQNSTLLDKQDMAWERAGHATTRIDTVALWKNTQHAHTRTHTHTHTRRPMWANAGGITCSQLQNTGKFQDHDSSACIHVHLFRCIQGR
jgi:hypothetical protein